MPIVNERVGMMLVIDSDGDGINDDNGDIDDDDGEDGAPVACGCVTTVTGGNRDGVTIRD